MARAMSVLTGEVWFTECPRWRDGRLWFADAAARGVSSISLGGDLRQEFAVDDPRGPAGIGWTPEGELLVVAMASGRILRRRADGTSAVHAELSHLSAFPWNDMVVDATGRAYVGNFGFDFNGEAAERGMQSVIADHPAAPVALVQPDGAVSVAVADMHFPNGSAITPDGNTLIVAETLAPRLAAFDIGADGALSNRREWAPLAARYPDGIALDAEGAVWFAEPLGPGGVCTRVAEGGEVLEEIETPLPCFACMLGGEDGRTLFMLTAPWTGEKGAILTARVEAARAGLP
jgi:sugar lactone lactonase YvrE